MKTLILLCTLTLAACGQPQLPKNGDRCQRHQASWTVCNEANEQIVCETTGRPDPDAYLWFFNGACTGHEGSYCQPDPTLMVCPGFEEDGGTP